MAENAAAQHLSPDPHAMGPAAHAVPTAMASITHGYPLSYHLVALCLALVLPILALAGLLTWYSADAERRKIAQEAFSEAHQMAAGADRELAGLIATTDVLSLSRLLQDGDLDRFDVQARDVYSRLGVNIVLRDLRGQQLVNTRVPHGAPLPVNVDQSDRIVLATKKPVVSNLFIGAVARVPLFIVNVPVLRKEEVIYLLNLSLPPERIRSLLIATPPRAGWASIVADGRGLIVASTGDHTGIVGQPLEQAIWAKIRDPSLLSGETVVNLSNGPTLVAFSRSKLSGWTAVITVPTALVTAALHRSLAILGIGATLILALAGGLAVIFTRRIARPVRELAVEAARLGRGESVRSTATRIREVNLVRAVLSEADATRRLAETSLRASEGRNRALSSATQEGIVIHTRWRIKEVNEAFVAMFRCVPVERVVGRRPLEFIATDARRDFLAKVRLGSAEKWESLGKRVDGSTFPIEISGRPILYQGQPMLVSVVRDLTAQKAFEATLRENEARLELAQLVGGVGTWDWDVSHDSVTCSEAYCRLYGIAPPGHQNAEAWLAQVHPDDRQRVLRVQRAAMVSGRLENEYRIVRTDGAIRWIIDRGVAMFDEEGRLTRFIGANVDVTEIREAEERLRELQFELMHASRLSAMGQMAAALAHEINQPLGATANFLSAAQLALESGGADGPARALARLEKAAEQTLRAGAIIRRLREFVTRGEADKRIVDARRLVEDGVALAIVGMRDPKLRLRVDFDAQGPPPILADAIQVQQVIFNLVRNALEATEGRDPREIVVATQVTGQAEVEISVADSGPGLPSDPETLFRPFGTTKRTGLGVGLSISRTIVEAHGGRLWAEPREGGGAVFRFTVPAARPMEDSVA